MKFSKLIFSILTVLSAVAAMDASAQATPPASPAISPGTSSAMSSTIATPMKGHGFAALDKNGDGVISRDEAAAKPMLAKMFDTLDTNKDGVLSKAEMKAALDKMHERHMMKIDTDRDGRISRAEAAAHPKLANHFDRIDTNGDGYLSKEIYKANQSIKAFNSSFESKFRILIPVTPVSPNTSNGAVFQCTVIFGLFITRCCIIFDALIVSRRTNK